MILKADDLEVGLIITVYRWIPEVEQVLPQESWQEDEKIATITRQDRSYCGYVLKITDMSLPYLHVEDLGTSKNSIIRKIKLDIRRVELMKLTEEYIKGGTYQPPEVKE